jgi:hypothetical protein
MPSRIRPPIRTVARRCRRIQDDQGRSGDHLERLPLHWEGGRPIPACRSGSVLGLLLLIVSATTCPGGWLYGHSTVHTVAVENRHGPSESFHNRRSKSTCRSLTHGEQTMARRLDSVSWTREHHQIIHSQLVCAAIPTGDRVICIRKSRPVSWRT